jgi:predicted nucleic acid-binding Zn ribbon protein
VEDALSLEISGIDKKLKSDFKKTIEIDQSIGEELKRDLQEAAQREKELRIKIALITIIIGVIILWLIL